MKCVSQPSTLGKEGFPPHPAVGHCGPVSCYFAAVQDCRGYSWVDRAGGCRRGGVVAGMESSK